MKTNNYNPLLKAIKGELKISERAGDEANKEWRDSLQLGISVKQSKSNQSDIKPDNKKAIPSLKLKKRNIEKKARKAHQKLVRLYEQMSAIFGGFGSTRFGLAAKNLIDVPGTGSADFPFQSLRAMKIGSKRTIDEWIEEVNRMFEQQEAANKATGDADETAASAPTATECSNESKACELGATLYEQTDGVEHEFEAAKFEATINRRVDFPQAALEWVLSLGANQEALDKLLKLVGGDEALKAELLKMAKTDAFKRNGKFQAAARSLKNQLDKVVSIYKSLLPDLLKILDGMYPELPEEMLIEVAARAIDQELMIILFVLWVWGDIFSQDRDERFVEKRAAIDDFVDGCFDLFVGTECGNCNESCRQLLKTMSVGHLFKCRFDAEGPSTLPAFGPIGAHAINIPFDMEKMIMLMTVLFAHEFMHDIFSDVSGLEDELAEVVDTALVTAFEKGDLKFSSNTIQIGNQKVKTISIVRKVFYDTLNEMNADVSGGILLTGPAFLEGMIVTFKALYGRILRRYGRENMFPNETIYMVDESGRLYLEAHLQPYIRAKIVRFALEQLGFKKEAKLFSEKIDQATELDTPPTVATWFDIDGNYPNIEIPCADLEAAGRIVVKAIMQTKLESLNGRSMKQIINWTRARQAKVDTIVKILCGDLTLDALPEGSLYETYVAAAIPLAYRRLTEKGMKGRKAIKLLEKSGLSLLKVVVARRRSQMSDNLGCNQQSSCGAAE